MLFIYGTILSIRINCMDNNCTIVVNKNSNLSHVSELLKDKLNINPTIFKISMYITYNQNNIKYGRYNLNSVKNLRDLISMLTSSSSDRVKVTIVEGWKVQDIALVLENKMDIDVENFISLTYDNKLINEFGFDIDIDNLEGFLFPDTYIFLKTYTEEDVIRVLVDEFLKNY